MCVRSVVAAAVMAVGVGQAADAATILTIGSGGAVTTIDRSATFDRAITADGAAGLTGIGLDYVEDGISIRTSGNFDPEIFYSPNMFDGKETGGFYYPNGGSYDPTLITNNFGLQAIEMMVGSGHRPINGFVDLNWATYGGKEGKSSGKVRVPLGSVVGFYNPGGFRYLEISSDYGNVISLDNIVVQDTKIPLVPLPASVALLPLGVGALAMMRKRRRAVS